MKLIYKELITMLQSTNEATHQQYVLKTRKNAIVEYPD